MQSRDYQRAKRRAPGSNAEDARRAEAVEAPAAAAEQREAPSRDPFEGGAPGSGRAGRPVPRTEAEKRPSAQGAGGEKPKRARRVLLIVGIIALLAAAAALAFALFGGGQNSAYDASAIEGQAPYKSQEEIQEELDRVVDAGMFNIAIVSSIEFDSASAPGKAYIENVPANRYCMQVEITEDATGDVLYESGILKPNSYIEDITLERELAPGTHEATATFTALDPDTLEAVGETAAQIALVVKQ